MSHLIFLQVTMVAPVRVTSCLLARISYNWLINRLIDGCRLVVFIQLILERHVKPRNCQLLRIVIAYHEKQGLRREITHFRTFIQVKLLCILLTNNVIWLIQQPRTSSHSF
jgi:hypothetical protein